MPQKIILDVDTGTDDAVALMCGALHPGLELVAATTVNGNVQVEYCTANTLRVFDYIGVNVPVYEGMSSPLVRPDFPIPRSIIDGDESTSIHGKYLDIPEGKSKVQSQHAVDFLIEYYMSGKGDDTVLVPVGPLTNVAMAIRQEPRIVEHIPAMMVMGGGHDIGNVSASAEFNIWGDPEGARVALTSGVKNVTLVPLDATHRALVSQDDCDRFKALGTPAGKAADIFVGRRVRAHDDAPQPLVRPHTSPVHDALAVLAVVDPSLLKNVYHCYVDVETFGEVTVGRTVCDIYGRSHKEPNCHVALDADEAKFIAMLTETLGRTAK